MIVTQPMHSLMVHMLHHAGHLRQKSSQHADPPQRLHC